MKRFTCFYLVSLSVLLSLVSIVGCRQPSAPTTSTPPSGNLTQAPSENVTPTLPATENQTTLTTQPATPTPAPAPKPVPSYWIDAHSHVNPGFSAGGLTGVDLLVSSMDKAGVGKAVLFRHPQSKTADVLEAYRKYPDRIVPVRGDDGLDVNDPTTLNPVRADLDTGLFRGLGEIFVRHAGAKVDIPADHPVMLELFKLAAEHGIPVTVHLDSPEKGLDAFERALNQSPSTTFIWAHSGPSTPDVLKGMLDRHPNLYADLSTLNPVSQKLAGRQALPSGYQIENSEWIRLMEVYPDRLLFGVDAWFIEAYVGYPDIVAWFKDNVIPQLSPKTAEAIAHGNAERLFGIAPSP